MSIGNLVWMAHKKLGFWWKNTMFWPGFMFESDMWI